MMGRSRLLTRVGLAALTLAVSLLAVPRAYAAEEMAHQCFQLTPYGDTIRLMRINSDLSPAIQGLFVRWRYSTSYQYLGSGVRTNSLTAGKKDINLMAMRGDTGRQFNFGAVFDPATSSGPWKVYDPAQTVIAEGTLTKISCSSAGLTSLGGDEVGRGGPAIFLE